MSDPTNHDHEYYEYDSTRSRLWYGGSIEHK